MLCQKLYHCIYEPQAVKNILIDTALKGFVLNKMSLYVNAMSKSAVCWLAIYTWSISKICAL